ncbi:hypothetical protein AWB90_18115 [Mycobacterium paraense]|uniref:Uncharacterized protein n=2 Tax=Mycobacterium paraense TaxID=767916 RepID=A0A1X2A740_9MYCO|nr:hypothetical protein AWB90_18115 [Mycobacterium paraense]
MWITNRLDQAIAYVLAKDDHRRHLEDQESKDPDWLALYGFAVPRGEHVRVPGLFVVELFPPSESHLLRAAIDRHNWHDPLGLARFDQDLLAEARSGAGYQWWKLGGFTNLRAWANDPDARRTKLPAQFNEIALQAVQIGESITAVAATFYVNEDATRSIDKVWQQDHQPELLHGREVGRPLPQVAQEVAIRRTQLARQEMHDAARRWLAKTCGGVFAVNGEPQPLIDLLLFTQRDATVEIRPDQLRDTAYRAIGLANPSFLITSPELPAMNLERVERRYSYVNGARTWALWGQRQAIIDQARPRIRKYGRVDNWAIVSYVREAIQDYLLRLSISELLSVYHLQYARMRDDARQQHGRFRMKNLEELRTNLLALSLNVGLIERDISSFNRRRWRSAYDAPFIERSAPRMRRFEERSLAPLRAPRNTNDRMASDQAALLARLKADDEHYRDVVSEAASLTSSLQALRTSRAARWIAAASLAVSLAVFSFSNVAEHPLIVAVIHWITGHH